MWRSLRIALLLMVLAGVAFNAVLDRRQTVNWTRPLWVGVFPVAGDASPATARYIQGLGVRDFEPIAQFMQREAGVHGGPADPIRIRLHAGPFPPLPERGATNGVVSNVLWSLRLRWYAWRRMQQLDEAPPRIRLFVVYHDPAQSLRVPHSVGLQKGLIGVVHAFAAQTERGGNQIVIAHELLHTLGSSDKYDARNLPLYPDGYADPGQLPLLPQRRAEIMAGRRAVTAERAEIPASLDETMIGPATAREIRWMQP
jgi:hypothetical protein